MREHLAAQQGHGEHLDADLLNAFAEQRLEGAERSGVLEHLSTCPECREVLALAAPEVAEPMVAAKSPRASWRMSLPQWGALGAAAAGVLVALLLVNPGKQSLRKATEANQVAQMRPPVAAQEAQANPATTTFGSAAIANKSAGSDENKRAEKRSLKPVLKQAVPARENEANDVLAKSDVLAKDAAVATSSAAPAALSPPAAAQAANSGTPAGPVAMSGNQTVEVTAQAPMVSTQGGEVASQAAKANSQGDSISTMSRKRSVPQTEALSLSANVAEVSAAALVASTKRPDGKEFRWQGPVLWKVQGGLRRVLGKWTGEITAVSFSSNDDGVLTTSTGETWQTTDGGNHWQKK